MIGPISTRLTDMLHGVSRGLLIPTITILLILLAVAVVELGGLLVELLTERRRQKVNVPQLIHTFQSEDSDEILAAIEASCLFRRQKAVLGELIRHAKLPTASLRALARHLLATEEDYYARTTDRTDLVARLAPMFGLMGTLIPLGPGIIALGQGDTQTLAASLLIAFDTTVVGLAAAGIAFVISRLRRRWYEDRLATLSALMESLLEVFDHGRWAEEQATQDLSVNGGC
ncbi:MAG: MotA/TolQ/ExbB proton channel family protein [Firmicutes bacterium]|jgi:biopolymer transport protein ExbB/TolQ|nr:MotA/TolQ/ExbB proton channel family protein [Bacillota bacterium]